MLDEKYCVVLRRRFISFLRIRKTNMSQENISQDEHEMCPIDRNST